MAARKGLKAKIIEQLQKGPMTGLQIEKLYIALGGAVAKKTKRLSPTTLYRLLNELPTTYVNNPRDPKIIVRGTYHFDQRRFDLQREAEESARRSKGLMRSLLP